MRLNRQNAERREKNYSGRGTAMMDFMETARIRTSSTQRKDVSKEDIQMLRDLLRKHSKNEFYKSLAIQLANEGGLTAKQIQSIHFDYEKLQAVVNKTTN
ncbi:MAG TPA: hypothetical protein VFR58_17675 [Flavisolibacter sp.]|nr:hypothetical protein [Flavisolibacter sp.]